MADDNQPNEWPEDPMQYDEGEEAAEADGEAQGMDVGGAPPDEVGPLDEQQQEEWEMMLAIQLSLQEVRCA
jgi:hypothetical protein